MRAGGRDGTSVNCARGGKFLETITPGRPMAT